MDEFDVSADPIAKGRTAAVYPVGDDRVVKVLEDGFDPSMISAEAAKMDAAHRAGAPAPVVYGTTEVDGRPGLVMSMIEGDLLIDEISIDPLRVRQWSRIFAATHVDTLTRTTEDLDDVRDVLRAKIERTDLDHEQRSIALRVLDAAPAGDHVLHGDFHPGNIILTKEGPVLIDWIDATRGHPGADIARTLWLMSPATVAPSAPNRRVLVAIQAMFRRWYRSRVIAGTKVDRRVVDAWRLPVVAARLDENIEWEDEALRAEVDRLTGR